jgi:hypothetical protein
MASFDKTIKSNRLLQSKRYTRATADSQEAFTQVIDLGVGEIYSQTSLIPTASIPYSSSAQDRQYVVGTDGITNIAQYYYRLRLTPDDQSNQSYFALSTPVTNADPQTVQTTQLTNWLSNKYVNPSFAATATAEAQSPSPVGYTIALSYGATTSSVTSISPNDYQFDYKSGVIQFTGTAPGGNIYLSGYRYVGRTLQDDSTLGISGSFSGSFQGSAELNSLVLTGSFNHTGSYTQIGDSTLIGNTEKIGNLVQDGNLTLTGSFNHTGSQFHIGDTTQTGSYNLTGSIDVVGPIISNGINVVDNAIAMAIALG